MNITELPDEIDVTSYSKQCVCVYWDIACGIHVHVLYSTCSGGLLLESSVCVYMNSDSDVSSKIHIHVLCDTCTCTCVVVGFY